MPESYSFTPQFATIRSASPLEGMRPVKAIHTALQFQPQKFLEVKSEQPELVSNAWASGLKEGIGDALKGITAAFVDDRKAKAQKTKEQLDRDNRLAVAIARGSKGAEEDKQKEEYKNAQLENLKLQIEERKKKAQEEGEEGFVDEDGNQGGFADEQNLSDMDAYDVTDEELPSGIWDLGLPEETEDVLNPLSSVGPTEQDVQALLSKPLSELTAEASPQKQYDQLTSTSLAPIIAPMSTDVVAGKALVQAQPSVDINTRSMSLMTPQERSAIAEKFYAETGEMPLGMGALTKVPLPEKERQQVKRVPQQPVETQISNLVNDYANYENALKSQKQLAEHFGPEYNEAEIQVITKKGRRGFRVNPPKRKTAKELAEEKGKGVEKHKLLQAHLEKFNNIDSAEATLKDIQGVLSEVGNKSGPMVGRLRQLIGGVGYDSLAIRLNNLVDSLTPGLARGVFGEVGVLTDDDVRRYKALIPNIQRDPKVAKILMDDLLNTLQTRKKITIGNLEKAGYDIENFKVTEQVPESENLVNSARQLVNQIKQIPEGNDKEALKAQLREIQIKLKK
jgi:hypothetical protein